jgi:hypothetical protein
VENRDAFFILARRVNRNKSEKISCETFSMKRRFSNGEITIGIASHVFSGIMGPWLPASLPNSAKL